MSKRIAFSALLSVVRRRAQWLVIAFAAIVTFPMLLPEPPAATHRVLAANTSQDSADASVKARQNQEKLRTRLQSAVDAFAEKAPGKTSIYIEHLPTGVVAAHKPENKLRTASLYKLFTARDALSKVDRKQWSLDMTVDSARKLSLQGCISLMITVSDNNCGQILQNMTGLAYAWGTPGASFPNTTLSGLFPASTAQDIAELLKETNDGYYLSGASSQLFMELLSAQQINTRLPQHLPDGASVAHKTGDLPGLAHDAGIVRTQSGSYIIVIMSEGWKDSAVAVDERIAQFSRSIYDLMVQLPNQR